MKKLLAALAVVAVLAGVARAQTTTTSTSTSTSTSSTTSTTLANNSTALTWTVAGQICGVPNTPRCVTFSCTTPAGGGYCDVGVSSLRVTFTPGASTITLAFGQTTICAAGSTCAAVVASTDSSTRAAVSTTLTACHYVTSTDTFRAYFPSACYPCFGGEMPSFTVSWQATSSAAC